MYHGNIKKQTDSKFGINNVNTLNADTDDKYNVGELDICNAASAGDCTGLISIPPQNEEEADSYQNIYTFGPPDV